jgi:Fe-S-cluster containining protein
MLFLMPLRDAQLVQIREARLIQSLDASLADAGRRAGDFLACRIGCTQCCHGAFAINALDAARLREGMSSLRATNPALATAIELRARAWIAEHGPTFPGDLQAGTIGTSESDQARFEDFANDAACPALDAATGRCDIYEWRPMTCRVFGPPVRTVDENGAEGLGHCELCFVGATAEQIAACEMPVPHELEAELLEEIGAKSETVVAFALLP